MRDLPAVQRVIDLQRLIVAFNNIERQILVPGASSHKDHPETDTEHSYTLAMAAWFITQNVPHLDTNKCIRYALAHDLIEVHAGDTFAYDKNEQSHRSKAQRELDARNKLRHDWPDFGELHEAIESYELRTDAESRFVYALDKLMPMVLNVLGAGKSWHEHNLSLDDVKVQKASKVAASPEITALYDELIGILEKNPQYFPA